MQLFELKNLISAKKVPKFLIFVGNEYEIMNAYIEKILEISNAQRFDIDSVNTVIETAHTKSLLYGHKLYINKYDKTLASSEKVWENLVNKLGNNSLIIVLLDIDKRSKFYKTFQDNIVEFVSPDSEVLTKMLSKYTELTEDRLSIIIEGCEGNYSKCLREIEKIKSYSQAICNCDDNTAFDKLLIEQALFFTNKENIFDFIDLVLNRNKKCYESYVRLKNQNESPIKLLSLLYSNFKIQYAVETSYNVTAEDLGVAPYAIMVAKKRRGKYTINKLKDLLYCLVDLEQGVKNGKYEEQFVIDYFLASAIA